MTSTGEREEIKYGEEEIKKIKVQPIEEAINIRKQLITIKRHVSFILGPNTHKSEKTGLLAGYELRIPNSTLAKEVIVTPDFAAARSMYVIEIPENERDAFVENAKIQIDKIKEHPFFCDMSVHFEPDYHNQKNKNALKLAELGTFVGVYKFRKDISLNKSDITDVKTDTFFAIVIQNYVPNVELEKMINNGSSIENISSSPIYQNAIKSGDENRNLMAAFILSLCNGKQVTDLESLVPLEPHTVNRYNVIDNDGRDQTCVYYDHCFSSWRNDNGILVGHGPERGFWLFKNNQGREFKLSEGVDRRTHLFPLGTRKLYAFESGLSYPRKGRMVSWGTTGPNPYSDKTFYEELTYDTPFYKSLSQLGLDFATTGIDVMNPIKVYVASPPIMSPLKSVNKKHMSLRHWLKYPMDPKEELIFLPSDHEFVTNHFMPLYVQYGKGLTLYLSNLIDSEESGKRGIYFKKPNLLKLIRATIEDKDKYNKILDSC